MKMMLPENGMDVKYELNKNHKCYHQYLKINPKTMDKVCVYCGSTVYQGLKNN